MCVLDKFTRDENGNIAILFSFSLVLLLLFAGGAVDFSRRNAIRSDLIQSLDAAGLAVAQLDAENGPEIANLSGAARDAYLKDYGINFFHENFSHEGQIQNLNVDFNFTPQRITPIASGRIKTLLLGAASGLLGVDSGGDLKFLSADAQTEITRRGSGPIELALVLDVTGSMNNSPPTGGPKKINSLKTAVDALLDALYGSTPTATSEDVLTSIVPFAAYVNAGSAHFDDGSSAWNSSWNDTAGQAFYHGAHFLHVDNTGAIDLNTKVNHFHLFNSMSSVDWAGCNEERPYPLDEIDVASGAVPLSSDISNLNTAPTGTTNSRMLQAFANAPTPPLSNAQLRTVANTNFVPEFAPDDPDCNSNHECEWGSKHKTWTLNGITYKGRWFHNPNNDGYSGYYNSYVSDVQYTYRKSGSSANPNFAKYLPVVNNALKALRFGSGYSGSNSGCPTSGAQNDPLYAFLTARGATECYDDEYILRQAYVGRFDDSNPADLKYDGKLNLSNNVSSSKTPNKSCPAHTILFESKKKDKLHDFVQTLTPGGNTNSAEGMMWGWRVLSPGAPFVSPYAYNDVKWQKAVVLMTDGTNYVSSRDTPWHTALGPYGYGREQRMGAGIDTKSEMEDEIDDKLLRICARMKEQGILVYAITFGLRDSNSTELATKEIFKACATEDEAPYYFDAPSGQDLEDAFADIAADLVNLHVSG